MSLAETLLSGKQDNSIQQLVELLKKNGFADKNNGNMLTDLTATQNPNSAEGMAALAKLTGQSSGGGGSSAFDSILNMANGNQPNKSSFAAALFKLLG